MKKNSIITAAIIAATAAAAAVSAAIILWRGDSAGVKTAVIYVGGEEIRRVDLSRDITEEFVIETENGSNTVRAENGGICVTAADCPDKVCVNQGRITSGAVPIVCLPHRLAIVIETDSDSGADAVTGGAVHREN